LQSDKTEKIAIRQTEKIAIRQTDVPVCPSVSQTEFDTKIKWLAE